MLVRAAVLAMTILFLVKPSAFSQSRSKLDRIETTSIGLSGDQRAAKAAPLFGVYDPPDRFRSSRHPAIEHVFVYRQALDKAMLTRKMRVAQEMGRTSW
jgi:endoglucanase